MKMKYRTLKSYMGCLALAFVIASPCQAQSGGDEYETMKRGVLEFAKNLRKCVQKTLDEKEEIEKELKKCQKSVKDEWQRAIEQCEEAGNTEPVALSDCLENSGATERRSDGLKACDEAVEKKSNRCLLDSRGLLDEVFPGIPPQAPQKPDPAPAPTNPTGPTTGGGGQPAPLPAPSVDPSPRGPSTGGGGGGIIGELEDAINRLPDRLRQGIERRIPIPGRR